jgi:hypothetical protein
MKAAVDGVVVLQCRLNGKSTLENCTVISEEPKRNGFGDAALAISKDYAETAVPQLKRLYPIREIIKFNSTSPSMTAVAPVVITNPNWLRRPTADELGEAYPEGARRHHIFGRVILDCTVTIEGTLEPCAAKEVLGLGWGFGKAALWLAHNKMKMIPQLRDGKPTGGAHITIPLNFGP